jgi:hypothetical protein
MTDVESVPLRTPLVGLSMDGDTAYYVGMLEGTIAALAINEVKYRALLELLTGDSWEETRIDLDGKVLMTLAANVLVKQTGMNPVQAKILVAKRWGQFNLPAETIVPQAIPIDKYADEASAHVHSTRRADLSARAREWRDRQTREAAEFASAATDLEADSMPKSSAAQDDS